ncbi:MAG: tetratricopeptide repeat protein [Myxococcales bacterium]|nr:tetratricopeptide repeat protein [Myxococcales bacterium]
MEIARDLIATGRPRDALDLLSAHHAELDHDPEYLLLCSAAWWADGDTLRAQQALQGAARLAPEDPRPLQGLGELLAERGEHDKAELLWAKARLLEVQARESDLPLEEMGPAADEDLIAFAEQRERKTQGALTPRQVIVALVGLLVVALLIAGIVLVTSPREVPSTASVPSKADTLVEQPAASEPAADVVELPAVVEVDEPEEPIVVELMEPPPAGLPELAAQKAADPSKPSEVDGKAPAPATPRKAAPKRRRSVATRSPAPAAAAPPIPEPPSDDVVRAELASMEPRDLTTRADKLYAQGHSALAAVYYRRALEIDPDFAPALVGMGRGILRAKKYSDAMKNATRALQLARGVDAQPGLEATAIYQMGRVHYERGERDAARHLFRQSISLPSAPPEAWFHLGEALSSDNSPAARQAYEKYLELVPSGSLSDRARRAIQ